MRDDIERVLIDEAVIEKRLDAMAAEIERDFPEGPMVVIILLKGALVFAADLLRRISRSLEIECLNVASYHGGTHSSGTVDFLDRNFPVVRGRHVLLLDDILDTGRTLHAVAGRLREEGAAAVHVGVLLAKNKARAVEVSVDYVGFEIGDDFVVGYGLDYKGQYRNLPFVGVLKALKTTVFLIALMCVGIPVVSGMDLRTAPDAAEPVRLAAREAARYLYLRTGLLPEDISTPGTIVIARKDAAIVTDASVRAASSELLAQQYIIRTTQSADGKTWWIVGGDDFGALYGTYRFAERLGVRFYLHGDVIPDRRLDAIPDMDETGKPLFNLRGVNPWGSHPFGFDAWGTDDYKAIFSQLAKMRMNFLGIHCYPEGAPYAEPTVWLGTNGDFDAQGRVKASYPSHYYNTLTECVWGPMLPRKTSDYDCGGSQLFADDAWAPESMRGHCPAPETPEACNEIFNRTARMFKEAFGFARSLGVKTCIGTEAPMVMPESLKKRLKAQGKNPKDPAVVREVYEAMFRRIMASHPLDFFWIWTPERWTWDGNKPEQYASTVADIRLAIDALKAVDAPFRLATCGWVLGPQHDRAAFDKDMPNNIPMAAISQQLGWNKVDPALGSIHGRETWAIPWLESDGRHGLASVQPFVGRTRRDAADALAHGCTGLMGLHWRTDILSPNASALAQAAWDQRGWNPSPGRLPGKAAEDSLDDDAGAGARRDLPCDDFYADWAAANFGPDAGNDIARVFASVDGRMPMSVADDCPSGALTADETPWDQVAAQYACVDQLERLAPRIHGAGNRARFDWWLDTFRYHRLLHRMRCTLGVFNTRLQKSKADAAQTIYQELIGQYHETYRLLLATVNSPGGLAMVVNMENQAKFRQVIIDEPAKRLVAALGRPLPKDLIPSRDFQGRARIIVPTVRSVARAGETLKIRVIVLDKSPPASVVLDWRPLGRGPFHNVAARHLARGVHELTLTLPEENIEYRIEAKTTDGTLLRWPATAPEMNQTLVVIGAPDAGLEKAAQ